MTEPSLIERLRAGICTDKCRAMEARAGCECAEAADALEAAADLQTRINGLEAMLADGAERERRLREALEEIAESRDAGRHDGLREECPLHGQYRMWLTARAATSRGSGT